MRRMAFAVVLVACCAAAGRADTLPMIDNLPATYTPGQSFNFALRVPELPDLAAYRLELVLSTEMTDPSLLAFPTVAPPGSYVFGSSANFAYQFDATPGGSEVQLTLTDSILPDRTNAEPGQNDMLAMVTVLPGVDLTGMITLSIGFGTRFDYNAELGEYEMPVDIPPIEQGGPPVGGNGVPAPPGVVLLGIGGLLLGARSRFARRAA